MRQILKAAEVFCAEGGEGLKKVDVWFLGQAGRCSGSDFQGD